MIVFQLEKQYISSVENEFLLLETDFILFNVSILLFKIAIFVWKSNYFDRNWTWSDVEECSDATRVWNFAKNPHSRHHSNFTLYFNKNNLTLTHKIRFRPIDVVEGISLLLYNIFKAYCSLYARMYNKICLFLYYEYSNCAPDMNNMNIYKSTYGSYIYLLKNSRLKSSLADHVTRLFVYYVLGFTSLLSEIHGIFNIKLQLNQNNFIHIRNETGIRMSS